jgi:lysophospholipase L1-like esterase
MAANTNTPLVDVYGDLATDLSQWISPYDGLHLTEAGYAEVARLWFAEIESAYEVQPSAVRQRTQQLKAIARSSPR